MNLDICCQCCVEHVKHVEKYTFTLSALNYCGGILLKSLCYLQEVVSTNFYANFFGVFAIFDCNFVKKKLWLHLARKIGIV